jgi:hypothetical protein
MYGVENMLPLFLLHEDIRQAVQFIWNKSKIGAHRADFELTMEA